jgi:hypothetical protein
VDRCSIRLSVWRVSEAKTVATDGTARRPVRSAILSTKFDGADGVVPGASSATIHVAVYTPLEARHGAHSKNYSASCGDHAERYFILLQAILKSICREKPVRPWIGGLRVAEASRWFA